MPEPRRVLMSADCVGGVWIYALELARALGARGLEVGLASMGAPLSREQRLAAWHTPGVELFESAYKLEWMEDPWDEVEAAGEWLLAIAADFKPDVVHLNGYAHGDLPWGAPTLVVGHSCVYSWWRSVHGQLPPAEWQRYRERVTRGLLAADRVVAPTAAMLSALERHYGPLPRKQVIANCREASAFPPGEKQSFVLAAGRLWDEAKNIRALASIADRLPWPVYVAGEHRHPDGGKASFPGVKPLGRLSPRQMAPYFAAAAIYTLPARYEPFGHSALEAALAGCALVLGDVESLREVWGEAAIYVPPDDPEALASAIGGLAADGARRRVMTEAARGRALRYSPEATARAYMGAYSAITAPVSTP